MKETNSISLFSFLIYLRLVCILKLNSMQIKAENMLIKFLPYYTITPKLANDLMRIEAARERVAHLPLTPTVLSSLREIWKTCTTTLFYND